MATSAESSRLPVECFLQPESEDEESFVVLGTSLPPESLAVDCGSEVVESIQTTVVQDSLKLTSSALSQLNNSTSSFPSLPKVNEQNVVLSMQPREFNTTTTNSSVDLSPDEIQQKVDMLIEENLKLKETLHQNNLAMKKQYDTLVLWQEDVMKVHQSHKEKFADTKKYIENLKIENAKLSEALKLSQLAQTQIKQELELLKSQEESGAAKEKADYSFLKSSFENLKEFELEMARKKISELEIQVNTLQIENLGKQHSSSAQNLLSEQVEILQKELGVAKQLNTQQTAELTKQRREAESLQKILLEEIKVLKAQLNEKVKTVITKETHENVQEQLMAAQMHITKLELLRNEDKEIINAKEEVIAKMEGLTKEMSDSNDTMAALRAQLELYKSDFEAERQAKDSIKAEKDQITDDLRHLQRRNQQLLEEVERLRGGDFVHISRPEQSEPSPSAPQDSPPPHTFTCPLCLSRFLSLRLVEDHIEYCLHNTP